MKKRFFGILLMGAMVVASMSMFTSCKDYDDDINKLQSQIDAITAQNLQSQLATLKSDLATAKSSLETAIAAKANASDLSGLASQSDLNATTDNLNGLASTVAGLTAQITAVEDALKKNDPAEMAATLAAITGDMEAVNKALGEEAAARAAVEKNLEIQTKALEKLQETVAELAKKEIPGYDDSAIKKSIADAQTDVNNLKTSLKDYAKSSDLATLKTDVQKLCDDLTKKVNSQINVLNALVNKTLSSLTLRPKYYWEGLEAIEAGYISQTPVFVPQQKDYVFTYTVTDKTLGDQTVKVTVKEVMTSALKAAVAGKSYVVLEGGDGKETFANGASAIVPIWKAKEGADLSLTIAEIDAAVKAYNATAVAKKIDIAKAVEAYYHVSPTKAEIEGAKLSFFENDGEVYTRGEFDTDGSIAATPYETTFSKDNKYNKFQNGVLKVPFKVNFAKVLSMFTDWTKGNTTDPTWDIDGHNAFGTGKKLPFISLEMQVKDEKTDKDILVNSDYGVVVPAVYTIVALADKEPDVALDENTFVGWDKHAGKIRANHLYESVGYNGAKDHADGVTVNLGAIPMPATHKVKFDDKINLEPYIQTHFSYTTYTKYGTNNTDKLMSADDLKAFGLHYEFTPITYVTSKNVTDQSAHIQQVDKDGKATTDKKSGWFAPRSVTDDGKTILDKTATREVIGREPLVRVDLVTEDGTIVRYGYIKLRITEDAQSTYEDTSVEFTFGDVYMNCGTEVRVTWSQMENIILAKLGAKDKDGKPMGITKKEFERDYYMENNGTYKVMPSESGLTDPASPSGTLYANAQANKWWGVRYYVDAKGNFAKATTTLANFTADNNEFGRVWYTPHDNSTNAHAWDENTNVIVWNLYGPFVSKNVMEEGGNMTKAYYDKMISVAKATYDTKGINKAEISTIIRFIHKTNGSSVYVKLILPVDKIHFQYAGIGNKDWSHWWKIDTQSEGVSGSTAPYWDEFDVHANTPVPAANANKALTVYQFEQDLYDYWKNKEILSLGYGKDKMSKFYDKAPVATFEFTAPVKDLNSKSYKGSWKVKGVSGTVWTLRLANKNKSIEAYQKDGAPYGPETVCYLADALDTYKITTTDGSVIHYNGLEDKANIYPAATDLLNKSGRYDEVGNARYTKSADATKAGMGILDKAAYLEEDIDETFTAYLKINVTHDCYNPLMGMNYFNVRFLRPINVAAKDYRVRDVLNKMQRIVLSDLIDIIDYRDIPVVPYYASSAIKQVFNYNGAKFTAPKYTDVTADNGLTVKEQNKGVPYEYYGITDLAVYYDNIRTDHDQEYAVRVNNDKLGATISEDAVKKLTKVKDLSSLASELTGSKPARVVSLYSNMSTIATDAPYVGTPMAKDTQWPVATYLVTKDGEYSRNIGKIEYTNNSGITQLFHIYVPIAIRYNWGNIKNDMVFGKPKQLDNNYTQTVWAVITVDPSYKEGSGEE